MINKILNRNKGIKIPTGWHQLSIGQYEEILTHFNEAERLKGTDDYNDVVLRCKVVAASVSMDKRDISKQPLALINKQFDTLIDFLSTQPQTPFINQFNMAGTTYIVNPNIMLNADQFILREQIVKAGGQHKHSDLVALYVWPKGETFKNENYKQIASLLYHQCPCSVLLPLSAFFLALGQACEPVIKDYLSRKTAEALNQVTKDIQETLQENQS